MTLKPAPQTGRKPLRIIAGTWRGRKMPLLLLDEVRPTTDRIRETLFNWLQPYIAGAHCLDAFAGSGILGLEALSRGAASVMFVEKQAALCKHLQGFLAVVSCSSPHAKVLCQSLPNDKIAKQIHKPFDLVFLDPPYQQALWIPVLNWLTANQFIHPQTLVFFEQPKTVSITWPDGWSHFREQTAGNVRFGLLMRESSEEKTI